MKTKQLIIVRGKGTANEKRIKTNITLYFSDTLKMWVSIPDRIISCPLNFEACDLFAERKQIKQRGIK